MRHLEEELQMACVKWFELQYHEYAKLLHHSPNGGKRNAREAARFKKMGTRAGFPDLVLLLPRRNRHFLCIEMKAGKGRSTENQIEYGKLVEANGGEYHVCRSLEEFMEIINEYLWKDG